MMVMVVNIIYPDPSLLEPRSGWVGEWVDIIYPDLSLSRICRLHTIVSKCYVTRSVVCPSYLKLDVLEPRSGHPVVPW
jgi:hypothetical protein